MKAIFHTLTFVLILLALATITIAVEMQMYWHLLSAGVLLMLAAGMQCTLCEIEYYKRQQRAGK